MYARMVSAGSAATQKAVVYGRTLAELLPLVRQFVNLFEAFPNLLFDVLQVSGIFLFHQHVEMEESLTL